jgi:hypothetical protein
MIRQMPFMLPLILSVVAAVFNNDEAQSSGHFIGRRKVECFQAGRGFRGLRLFVKRLRLIFGASLQTSFRDG